MEQCIRRCDGKFVTVYQVVKFFERAYLRTATADSAVIGVIKWALPLLIETSSVSKVYFLMIQVF
jgi:hypothetical protein